MVLGSQQGETEVIEHRSPKIIILHLLSDGVRNTARTSHAASPTTPVRPRGKRITHIIFVPYLRRAHLPTWHLRLAEMLMKGSVRG